MLRDGFGRELTYLRVSLLKGCNLTCSYCMPERIPFRMDEVLSPLELEQIVGRFVERGIHKLRFTGGEPTIRPDIVEIVERLARLEGVRDLALSTNATRFVDLAKPLYAAGVRRINISLDTLRPQVFKKICGSDMFDKTINGIDAALEAGFDPIKLNTVVLRGINDDEIVDLVKFAAARNLQIRFIEMMPTAVNRAEQPKHYVSNEDVLAVLGGEEKWNPLLDSPRSGPARYFVSKANPEAPRIGFINPMSQNFCGDCNRLRLTADGKLRTCLFGNQEHELRPALAAADWRSDLDQRIDAALLEKPESHYLERGDYGTMKSFVQIGG